MPHYVPCLSTRCVGLNETLAALVLLMQDLTGVTTEELDNAIKDYRTITTDNQLWEHLLASFDYSTVTSEDLKCVTCLSEIELKRRIFYLSGIMVENQR